MATIINNNEFILSADAQADINIMAANVGVDEVYVGAEEVNGFVTVYFETESGEPFALCRVLLSDNKVV